MNEDEREKSLDYRESRIKKAMLEGDKEAMSDVHNLYGEALLRRIELLWGDELRRCSSAFDVAQETWLKVLEARSSFTFRGESAFVGWLTRIGSNICRHEFRRRNRLTEILKQLASWGWAEREPHPYSAPLGKPAPILGGEERWERFRRAFKQLPRHSQYAFYATKLEQRPVADVAKELRMETKAFSQLLWRAQASFRELYGDASTSLGLPNNKELTPPPDPSTNQEL